jgi:hypothetical protein
MRIFILVLLLLSSRVSRAQSYEGTVKHQNRQQPAAILDVAHPTDLVMAAMAGYLRKKKKSSQTDIEGFSTFLNSQMPDMGANADLYFRVEPRGDKDRETSVVYLLLTTLKTDQVPPDTLHYLDMKDAKTYLNDLALVIEAYDLDRKVEVLKDEIYFSESVYTNLETDSLRLAKDRSLIDSRIVTNDADLKRIKEELQMQKRKLTDYNIRRK